MKKLLTCGVAVFVILSCSCITIVNTPQKTGHPVISTFTASPQTIQAGESAKLVWNVTRATKVSIDQGKGDVSSSGAIVVSPGSTTTYTLIVTGSDGTGVTATAQVAVSPSSAPVILSFSASPPLINAGNAATLSWSISGATSIIIDNGIGAVASAGSRSVSPGTTTVYMLTATNLSGSVNQSLQITVPRPDVTQPGLVMQGKIIPGRVTNITISVSPTRCEGEFPYNFQFSATISVDGPCTVTYVWGRSDLLSFPQQTETFTAAGSRVVSTGWPRNVSGTYWVRVHILTPEEMVSDRANFTLRCQ